jgi:hypothetical protein
MSSTVGTAPSVGGRRFRSFDIQTGIADNYPYRVERGHNSMGMLWTVWPLDYQMKAWLQELEVPHPNVTSRFPTGREIQTVLSQLHGFNVEIRENGIGSAWQASVVSVHGGDNGGWALLNVNEYPGDHEEQQLWFEKGWESVIKIILRQLANVVGPLVLIDDADGQPQIIV